MTTALIAVIIFVSALVIIVCVGMVTGTIREGYKARSSEATRDVMEMAREYGMLRPGCEEEYDDGR